MLVCQIGDPLSAWAIRFGLGRTLAVPSSLPLRSARLTRRWRSLLVSTVALAACSAAADLTITLAPSTDPGDPDGTLLTWWGNGAFSEAAGTDPRFLFTASNPMIDGNLFNNIGFTEGAGQLNAFYDDGSGPSNRARVIQFRTSGGTPAITLDHVGAGQASGETYAFSGTLNVESEDLVFASSFQFGDFAADDDLGFGAVSVRVLQSLPSAPVGSLLPTSRSVSVSTAATAFATLVNTSNQTLSNCGLVSRSEAPATFFYQTTNPATNEPTGSRNTPVTLGAGASQSFLFGYTPLADFGATEIPVDFGCAGVSAAATIPGINTFVLAASSTPVADIIAVAATVSGDGAVRVSSTTDLEAFSVAAVNVGASDTIDVSAEPSDPLLPVTVTLCETNPLDGACLAPPAPVVSAAFAQNESRTFSLFVATSGAVPFDPAANRVNVRFDVAGARRGSTSVAVLRE